VVSLGARPLAASDASLSFTGVGKNGRPQRKRVPYFDGTMRRPVALLSLGGSLGAQTTPPGFPQQNWRGGVGASPSTIIFSDHRSGRTRLHVLFWFRAEPVRFSRRGI